MKKNIIILCLSVYLLNTKATFAQNDPLLSQYMFNEMYINPAYAGSREAISMTAAYRNQWLGIEGAPVTQTFAAHAPLLEKKMGAGINIINEQIGVLKNLGVLANYAYRMMVHKETRGFLSFGLQAGIVNKRENLSDVKTIMGNDAQFAANIPRKTFPNFGFGTYYYSNRFYAGISIPRLINNYVGIDTAHINSFNVSNKLSMRTWHYFITGGYIIDINRDLQLKPSLMLKMVAGSRPNMDINFNALFNRVLWVGLTYRTNAAWTFITSFQVNNQLRIGYSYDYSTTKLRKYNTGSHEITLGYDFTFQKSKITSPRYF